MTDRTKAGTDIVNKDDAITWIDELKPGDSWMGVWRGLQHCGHCSALIAQAACTECGHEPPRDAQIVTADGRTYQIPSVSQGPIPYATHLLLGMMQREWGRPLNDDHWLGASGPSQRASIVLLFWTQFEILTERLLEAGMADYPARVREDLLRRYGGVGARLDQLYRIVFSTTFWEDLTSQGDGAVAAHLRKLQEKRNAFTHGQVESISETDIVRTVHLLQDTQAAWIRIYNRRCTGRVNKSPVWDVRSARGPRTPSA